MRCARPCPPSLPSYREDISRLMQAAVEASAEAAEDGDAMIISGERKLLDVTDIASDMDRLRKMFSLFEKKTDLLQLLDVSSRAQGVQIYIGGDSQLVPMEEVSVITAPYGVDGKVVGTLGVIGPTRMAYERVIPIVDITARFAVQRPQPQPVGPFKATSSLRRKGSFCVSSPVQVPVA